MPIPSSASAAPGKAASAAAVAHALGAPPALLHPAPVTLAPLRVRAVWHSRVQGDPGVAWLRQSLVDAMAGLTRAGG